MPRSDLGHADSGGHEPHANDSIRFGSIRFDSIRPADSSRSVGSFRIRMTRSDRIVSDRDAGCRQLAAPGGRGRGGGRLGGAVFGVRERAQRSVQSDVMIVVVHSADGQRREERSAAHTAGATTTEMRRATTDDHSHQLHALRPIRSDQHSPAQLLPLHTTHHRSAASVTPLNLSPAAAHRMSSNSSTVDAGSASSSAAAPATRVSIVEVAEENESQTAAAVAARLDAISLSQSDDAAATPAASGVGASGGVAAAAAAASPATPPSDLSAPFQLVSDARFAKDANAAMRRYYHKWNIDNTCHMARWRYLQSDTHEGDSGTANEAPRSSRGRLPCGAVLHCQRRSHCSSHFAYFIRCPVASPEART